MRNTHLSKAIGRNTDGKLIGVNLGSDFCTEHEWGIKDIKREMGISDKGSGYDCHKATSHGSLSLELDEKTLFIHMHRGDSYFSKNDIRRTFNKRKKEFTASLKSEFERGEDPSNYKYDTEGHRFVAAWDKGSFAIMFHESLRDDYKALSKALKSLDICVSIGGSQFIENGGLCLLISSQIPIEWERDLKSAQRDVKKLKKASKKTGIHKVLEKADKEFFALSPRWDKDNKGEVIFWLNPMGQDIYNFGWFSVKELTEWAKNKGPVMKSYEKTC